MIHRCYYCRRIVWPWQSKGWGNPGPLRRRRGERDWWHLSCRQSNTPAWSLALDGKVTDGHRWFDPPDDPA